MRNSIEKAILLRIHSYEETWAFSSKDFADLGSRQSVDTALHRLQAAGAIRRVMRGIYDSPAIGKLTGKPVSPDIWSVAQTIARKNGWKILPSGETALNALGLSAQVPGTYLFFTDGQSRVYNLGKRRVTFRKKSPKDLQSADGTGALVTQALKALGSDRINSTVVENLRRRLSQPLRRELLRNTQYGTGWIYDAVKRVCMEEGDDG